MANRLGQHAVVIGGSMAGLMTARVLADHFEHVTVLERDPIDGSSGMRKSVPQGAHLHGLLFGGQQALMALYPDWVTELERRGAVRYRVGTEAWVYMHPDGKAYSPTGAMRQPYDLGFDGYSQSRGLLEQCVRRCTLALANVQLASGCTVHTLQCHNGRVHGVLYTHEGASQTLAADLVVDAGGRGAHTPRWLAALGFPRPEETTIGIDIAHASTRFRKPAAYDAPARGVSCFGPTRPYRKRALLQEIEQQTWLLSLVGRLGDYPPTAEEGFFAFAKEIVPPPLYQLLREAERIADIVPYRFPTSLYRHYERLTVFPEGLLVIGDALCSINPVYAQGMSLAALEVQALRELLTEHARTAQGLEGVALRFFAHAANVISAPWTMAANQDFAFPQTQGERPANLAESGRYFAALNALAGEDVEVYRLVTDVFHLVKPMAVLQEEPLRSRVLAQLRKQPVA